MYHTETPTQTETGHWLVPVARDADGVIVAYGTSAGQSEAERRARVIAALLTARDATATALNTPTA